MQRVVILGRAAAGKTTLGIRLSEITGLPAIELDKLFWRPGVEPIPAQEWTAIQQTLVRRDRWILDGDLGKLDSFEVRISAADTIILLDFSLPRCAWQAIRRSIERPGFWIWLVGP